MRDGERLFSIGIQSIIFTAFIIAIFHSAFSADAKEVRRKSREITTMEQELNNAKVRYAALTRPEVLRPIINGLFPDYRPIGTGRVIHIRDLQ